MKNKVSIVCYNTLIYICIVFKPHCTATGLISNHKDKQYRQNKRMKMAQSEFRIIRETQVNTPESLLTMANGQTVKVSCKDFSPYGTVKSAAARLNQRLNKIEFEVTTPDNGATIIIKRN